MTSFDFGNKYRCLGCLRKELALEKSPERFIKVAKVVYLMLEYEWKRISEETRLGKNVQVESKEE